MNKSWFKCNWRLSTQSPAYVRNLRWASSAYILRSQLDKQFGRSLIYNRNSSGPKIVPWGTPQVIERLLDIGAWYLHGWLKDKPSLLVKIVACDCLFVSEASEQHNLARLTIPWLEFRLFSNWSSRQLLDVESDKLWSETSSSLGQISTLKRCMSGGGSMPLVKKWWFERLNKSVEREVCSVWNTNSANAST